MNIENKIFYIAGPITGIEDGNKPMFNQAHLWLASQKAVVLNPSFLPPGLTTHQSYMNICLPMLREADAVLMLPGWHRSVGAKMEYDEARKLGIPVFRYEPVKNAEMVLMAGGEEHGL